MDLSRLRGQALRDARWVLTFKAGTPWLRGSFSVSREAELVRAGVLVSSDDPTLLKVGA